MKRKNRRRAFTAIEMVAVLLLSALMATLTITSLAGVRHAAQMNELIDQFAWCNDVVRTNATRLHAPLRLVIDPVAGVISEKQAGIDDMNVRERVLLRLPNDFKMTRCIFGGGEDAIGQIQIPVSPTGVSPSFAVQIHRPKQTCWALVSGLTGKMTRIDDEHKISAILESLSSVGNDAH